VRPAPIGPGSPFAPGPPCLARGACVQVCFHFSRPKDPRFSHELRRLSRRSCSVPSAVFRRRSIFFFLATPARVGGLLLLQTGLLGFPRRFFPSQRVSFVPLVVFGVLQPNGLVRLFTSFSLPRWLRSSFAQAPWACSPALFRKSFRLPRPPPLIAVRPFFALVRVFFSPKGYPFPLSLERFNCGEPRSVWAHFNP